MEWSLRQSALPPLPGYIYADIKLLNLVGVLPGGDVIHTLAHLHVAHPVLQLQGRGVAALVLVLDKHDICLFFDQKWD